MTELEQALEALRALPRKERRAAALRADERFERAVELASELDDAALLALAAADAIAAAIALEALARRPRSDELVRALLDLVGSVRGQTTVFLLGALDRHVEHGLVTQVLARAEPGGWTKAALEDLRAVARRRDEPVEVDAVADLQLEDARALAVALGDAIPASVLGRLERMAANRDVAENLQGIGRVRRAPETAEAGRRTLTDDALERDIAALVAAVRAGKPLLVVGERGSGRLSRLRAAAGELARDGWITFEAGAAEVNAGMTYVGELEGRMRHLVRTLGGKEALWIVPALEQLLYAGTYRQNPRGALDLLLAGLADARVHVAGIVDPGAYERLVRARPQVRDAFDVVRVAPLDEPRTLALAARLAPATSREVLREALALGRHFLGDAALPGSLLSLLETMRRRGRATTG